MRLAHRFAHQTLGTSNSCLSKGMKGLDEGFELGQEEVVWAREAECCVDGIVAYCLGDLSIGQVPEGVRGWAELSRVARDCIASFIVDGACNGRDVGYFAGLEEAGDGVCECDAVNHGGECSHSTTKCQVLEDPRSCQQCP